MPALQSPMMRRSSIPWKSCRRHGNGKRERSATETRRPVAASKSARSGGNRLAMLSDAPPCSFLLSFFVHSWRSSWRIVSTQFAVRLHSYELRFTMGLVCVSFLQHSSVLQFCTREWCSTEVPPWAPQAVRGFFGHSGVHMVKPATRAAGGSTTAWDRSGAGASL